MCGFWSVTYRSTLALLLLTGLLQVGCARGRGSVVSTNEGRQPANASSRSADDCDDDDSLSGSTRRRRAALEHHAADTARPRRLKGEQTTGPDVEALVERAPRRRVRAATYEDSTGAVAADNRLDSDPRIIRRDPRSNATRTEDREDRESSASSNRVAAAGSTTAAADHDETDELGAQPTIIPASDLEEPPRPRKVPESAEFFTEADQNGLTLDQTIHLCLVADPVIRAGLESINLASGDAITACLLPNPTFFTDGQLLPLTHPFSVTRQGGPPQQDFLLSYPVDWFLFGKRAAAMRSTSLAIQVSENEYADLVRRRVLEAAVAYYDVLEARALRDVAQQDLRSLRQVEQIIRDDVGNVGARARVDLSRVELDRLRSEQTLREAEYALVAAKARLRTLLGATTSDDSFLIVGNFDTFPEVSRLSTEEAYALALENRPDLAALRAKVNQSLARLEVEQRNAYPTLAPTFGYTRQYQTKAIGYPDADSWSAALTMSVPIFDRNQGNQYKAASLLTQNQHLLQAGMVNLRSEVEQAVQQHRTAETNARAIAGEQLRVAEQVRDITRQAYSIGERSLLEVLDAQRNYRDTYRLYITSRAGLGRASVRLNAALGSQLPGAGS